MTSEAQDTTKGPTTAAVEDEGTTELLRAAVEAAVDGFLVTDETGRVVFANPAVEKMTGCRPATAVGQSMGDLLSEREIPLDVPLGQSGWRGHFVSLREDGTVSKGECTVTPVVGPAGERSGCLVLLRDVTSHLRLAEIAAQVTSAEEIGEVLARVRHELGNPINAVVCTLRLLSKNLSRFDEATMQRYLERALEEMMRTQQILGSLRNVTQKDPLRSIPVDLQLFVRRLIKFLNSDPAQRGVSFIGSVEDSVTTCHADPLALQRVLLSIVSNAVDACWQKPQAEISLIVARHTCGIALAVKDNGGGLSSEARQQLFRPLWSSKPGGTGLGLFMARKLIANMGGTIGVRSEHQVGTVVEIVLPEGPP